VREDRTKRLQLTIERRTSAQINEFYAPLRALTDQLDASVSVKEAVEKDQPAEVKDRISKQMHTDLFLPLHEQINGILKTKVHLLEGIEIPKSFTEFFVHTETEKAYWKLEGVGIDVSNAIQMPYPEKFYDDVRSGFDAVIWRYENSVEELRHPCWLFGSQVGDK